MITLPGHVKASRFRLKVSFGHEQLPRSQPLGDVHCRCDVATQGVGCLTFAGFRFLPLDRAAAVLGEPRVRGSANVTDDLLEQVRALAPWHMNVALGSGLHTGQGNRGAPRDHDGVPLLNLLGASTAAPTALSEGPGR